MHFLPRCCLLFVVVIALLSGCVSATPAPAPTVVPTDPPTATPVPPTPTSLPTSTPTATPLPPTATLVPPTATKVPPTDTPAPTATATRKPITVTPRNTSTPKPPAAPPLADAVRKTLTQVESLGGALDRLYGGSVEACRPFMADYNGVANSPQYDVAAQPANIQGAYAAYRQAISVVVDKVGAIAEICQKGGGAPGRLSFDVARMAINDAGSTLTGALNALGQ